MTQRRGEWQWQARRCERPFLPFAARPLLLLLLRRLCLCEKGMGGHDHGVGLVLSLKTKKKVFLAQRHLPGLRICTVSGRVLRRSEYFKKTW